MARKFAELRVDRALSALRNLTRERLHAVSRSRLSRLERALDRTTALTAQLKAAVRFSCR